MPLNIHYKGFLLYRFVYCISYSFSHEAVTVPHKQSVQQARISKSILCVVDMLSRVVIFFGNQITDSWFVHILQTDWWEEGRNVFSFRLDCLNGKSLWIKVWIKNTHTVNESSLPDSCLLKGRGVLINKLNKLQYLTVMGFWEQIYLRDA